MNTTERAAHPSTAQIHALLNVLEKKPSLAKGFPKVPSARDAARKTWEKLAIQLNSLEGCVKTWKQWTKYWADKKSAVKKKAALQSITRNNGGDEEVVELSEIEERILSLVGGHRHLDSSTYFKAHSGQYPENSLASTQLIGQNPKPSLPMFLDEQTTPTYIIEDLSDENVPVVEMFMMYLFQSMNAFGASIPFRRVEMLIVEDSEQSGSDHGAGLNFAKFQESTDNQLLESSRESNTERPMTPKPTSRKREESHTDPLSDYFHISKRQRGTQFSPIRSENEEAVRECDLYGQLLAQKLKPLDIDDRLVLMNDIDNLVFKFLTNIRRRRNLSANGQLPSIHQTNLKDSQSINLAGSFSQHQTQDGAQKNIMNSQSTSEVLSRLKTEIDTSCTT